MIIIQDKGACVCVCLLRGVNVMRDHALPVLIRSTYALTLYRHNAEVDGQTYKVDLWDTVSSALVEACASSVIQPFAWRVMLQAGQERFNSMHPSYYYKAHACILVFDVTRKVTYQNLANWCVPVFLISHPARQRPFSLDGPRYQELRTYCESIPCLCVANKIDVDEKVTTKAFAFPTKHGLPFFYASAADGTNVVQLFQEAIRSGVAYKLGEKDFVAEVLELLGDDSLGSAGSAITGAGGAGARPVGSASSRSDK